MIDSVILGVVEGFTEFLPISSTAHLILSAKLLRLEQSEFLKTFEIVIQSGAILAVIALYWRKFLRKETWGKVLAAFFPTAVLGFVFYPFIKAYLLESVTVVLWTLALGGLFLILFERMHRKKESLEIKEISYPKALLIGIFQAVAMVPGVSRAAATIIGGLVLGIKRETIVEFSFLLAVPTMFAATGLDLVNSAALFTSDQMLFLAVGFVTSFVAAIASIKFLLSYIKHHTFTGFGVYRIALAVLFALFVL